MFPGIQSAIPARGDIKMAADYILPDDTAPTGFDRSFKMFIAISIILLTLLLIWLLGIAPFRAFSKIDINGGEVTINGMAELLPQSQSTLAGELAYFGISKDEIFAKAGIRADSCYFTTSAPAIEKALSQFASFETVRVIKHFPDRLQIVLEGRRPVASAFATRDGRTVPVLLDSQGVIFRIGSEIEDGIIPRLLPIISGLVIEDPYPGMKLPVLFAPLFKQLEKMETSAPELLAAVSELRIVRRSFDGFDVVLYPANKRVKVHLSEINEDLLRYTLLMVDVLASRDPTVDSLDFRSGIASYIPKEASSE